MKTFIATDASFLDTGLTRVEVGIGGGSASLLA